MFGRYLVATIIILTVTYFLVVPTAVSASIQHIRVEVVGSFLFVDVYLCPSDSYVELPTLGNPLLLVRTYPEGVYAVIENRSLAVLVTQPATCVRISYVSEAEDLGKSLGFSYSGDVVELDVIMNFSFVVPSALSPYPHDIFLNDTKAAVFRWYNVSRVSLEYVIVPQVVEVGGQMTITRATAAITSATQTVSRTLTSPSSPPQTSQTSRVSIISGGQLWQFMPFIAAIGYLVILLVLLVLRGRRKES